MTQSGRAPTPRHGPVSAKSNANRASQLHDRTAPGDSRYPDPSDEPVKGVRAHSAPTHGCCHFFRVCVGRMHDEAGSRNISKCRVGRSEQGTATDDHGRHTVLLRQPGRVGGRCGQHTDPPHADTRHRGSSLDQTCARRRCRPDAPKHAVRMDRASVRAALDGHHCPRRVPHGHRTHSAPIPWSRPARHLLAIHWNTTK